MPCRIADVLLALFIMIIVIGEYERVAHILQPGALSLDPACSRYVNEGILAGDDRRRIYGTMEQFMPSGATKRSYVCMYTNNS